MKNTVQAAKALLETHPEITALICLSDRFAVGAIHYCQRLAVPQRVAVTGFDNLAVEVAGIRLTTIAQDAEKERGNGRQIAAHQRTGDPL